MTKKIIWPQLKKFSNWVQVMPENRAEHLRPQCEYCQENKYCWIINGRSSGLTRTFTAYSCNNCIWKALARVRWEK
jgi:hypothetical protein